MADHLSYARVPTVSEKVLAQSRYFHNLPELTVVLDAMPSLLIIINGDRQIVFANRHLKEAMQIQDVRNVYGLRPGDLMDCAYLTEEGATCGATEACQMCGGNQAIADCRRGHAGVQECRITQRQSGKALDLRITGTPINVGGEPFSLLVLTDISHEKRRQALERVFFHDLMNVATGIITCAGVLNRMPGSPRAGQAADSIRRLVFQLTDELKAQRELAEAESDELKVFWEPVGSRETLSIVLGNYREHEVARDRTLVLDPAAADTVFSSDRTLLARVLGNMVKNALEASRPGDTITGTCLADDDSVEFRVHNPGVIPREVQLQVFQRSFSTKGRGRGLGTYSIRLLTEHYLKGQAWFTTSPDAGTTFHVRYPRQPS